MSCPLMMYVLVDCAREKFHTYSSSGKRNLFDKHRLTSRSSGSRLLREIKHHRVGDQAVLAGRVASHINLKLSSIIRLHVSNDIGSLKARSAIGV